MEDVEGRIIIMLLRKLPLLLVPFALLCSNSARAQLGIYGTVTGQRFGGITCPTFASPCGDNNGHVQPYGGSFGAFYDLRSYGPVRLGVDARGDVLTSNKRADSSGGGRGSVRQYDVLAGVRGSVRTPITWLHPYAEVAGGYSRNNASGLYTNTTTVNNTVTPPTSLASSSFNPNLYNNYALVKGFVGLDIKIASFLDVRLIELGAGEAFGSANTVVTVSNAVGATGTISSSSVTTTSPSSHSNESIGAGIVFHLPR